MSTFALEINDAVRELPEEIDFPAIMQLLNSKHTVHVIDRHVRAISKICQQSQNGFLLKHLPYLAELVETISARWRAGIVEFATPICEIAKIASLPFVSCAAEDLLQYGKFLPAFVNAVVTILGDALPQSGNYTLNSINSSNDQIQELQQRNDIREMMRIEISYMIASIARYGLDDPYVRQGIHDSVIQNVAKSGTPSLRLLQQTSAIQEMVQVFRVEHSPQALVIMLGALKDMSLYQPLAIQITNVGLLSNLIAVIRANLLGSDVLLVSAEILWNVLELDPEHSALALGGMDVMESFVAFLVTVLFEGYRYKDKIFRNDMIALLHFIAGRSENHENFAKSGLLLLLLKHCSEGITQEAISASGAFEKEIESLENVSAVSFFPKGADPSAGGSNSNKGENGTCIGPNQSSSSSSNNSTKKPVPLTTSQEDMEYRILIWRCISRTSSNPLCAEMIEKFLFTTLLLGYLDVVPSSDNNNSTSSGPALPPPISGQIVDGNTISNSNQTSSSSNSTSAASWSKDQKRKLQLEAIRVLFLVVPYCSTSFIDAGGNGIVIRLLQSTNDRSLQQACLTLLHRCAVAPTKADGLEQIDLPPCCPFDESHIGIVRILLNIFADNNNNYSFLIRQLACSIIGCLCRQDEEYSSEFRKRGGVQIIADEIKWSPQSDPSGFQDRLFFTIYVVDCVWCAIVGDRKNESQFLKCGALFQLLDALEFAPIILRRHIMACVADLVQNKHAAQLFVQWNSKTTMKGGLKILLEFWNEEQSIADAVSAEGLIRDLDFPLNPKNNPTRGGGGQGNSAKHGQNQGGGDASPFAVSPARAMADNVDETAIVHKLQNPASSAATLDLAERVDHDSRPKIYAILSNVGFEGHETLTMAERQSLETLRLLPECLVLEQLKQVQYNLRDFKLLAQDQRHLDELIAEQRTRTEWIRTVQTQLYEESQTSEVVKLQRYYDDIRNRIPAANSNEKGD